MGVCVCICVWFLFSCALSLCVCTVGDKVCVCVFVSGGCGHRFACMCILVHAVCSPTRVCVCVCFVPEVPDLRGLWVAHCSYNGLSNPPAECTLKGQAQSASLAIRTSNKAADEWGRVRGGPTPLCFSGASHPSLPSHPTARGPALSDWMLNTAWKSSPFSWFMRVSIKLGFCLVLPECHGWLRVGLIWGGLTRLNDGEAHCTNHPGD